ncbi:putative uncharacterized protein encoded by LINC00269 isoform X2 [Macaca nemestrina]|uniref:putative uncharacterized protein encoded by LINC00269 isoform X2 n=1 Tax=Macaca nemestrina TaxID=9545 RepID=UPI0039B9C783
MPSLIFIFLVETGFHHIGQGDLERLTSREPPASYSQSAGITGWSTAVVNRAHCSLELLGSSDLPASVSRVAGTAVACHHVQVRFFFAGTGSLNPSAHGLS